jgi:hypothetical protein
MSQATHLSTMTQAKADALKQRGFVELSQAVATLAAFGLTIRQAVNLHDQALAAMYAAGPTVEQSKAALAKLGLTLSQVTELKQALLHLGAIHLAKRTA